MRYYIDTEFDGHAGPLLSLAMVGDDDSELYVTTDKVARDPWVQANVSSQLGMVTADYLHIPVYGVGTVIRRFMSRHIQNRPVIVADAVGDIARFCSALNTETDGSWRPIDYAQMNFEVHSIDPYPTTLPNAVQHNALWDARALRRKLQEL